MKQEDQISCVYFIKNGSVSLSLTVTLTELIDLLDKIGRLLRIKIEKTPLELRFVNEQDIKELSVKKSFKVSFLNVSLL
jgi:hypothetical protein